MERVLLQTLGWVSNHDGSKTSSPGGPGSCSVLGGGGQGTKGNRTQTGLAQREDSGHTHMSGENSPRSPWQGALKLGAGMGLGSQKGQRIWDPTGPSWARVTCGRPGRKLPPG